MTKNETPSEASGPSTICYRVVLLKCKKVLRDWTVAKSFKKLKIRNHDLGPVRFPGPPVPPRPWATLSKAKDEGNEIATISSSKIVVPVEVYANKSACDFRKPCCQPVASVCDDVPARPQRYIQKALMGDHTYSNLGCRPPAIDRALKPRFANEDENKEHVLQYLDLDLHSSSSSSASNCVTVVSFEPRSVVSGSARVRLCGVPRSTSRAAAVKPRASVPATSSGYPAVCTPSPHTVSAPEERSRSFYTRYRSPF
ncbi:hypothetical protein EVAR_67835_1 [Eumeta japonica]|uniref:Uncharacterized protein n=1 Tax=Eumeta variegata TaxID=151549 RepID=A0A4C1SNM5_EUMVA|nr:hypothetical protein EVAR_67835_1 [Eumeta japonica]